MTVSSGHHPKAIAAFDPTRKRGIANLAIVMALALLAVIGWQWLRYQEAVEKSRRWEDNTQRGILKLGLLLSDLKDAETGQRGYLLTGDENYLEPYRKSLARVQHGQSVLEELFVDDPDQRQRLAVMEPIIREKLAELRETIELYASGERDAAFALMKTGRGAAVMDEIRSLTEAALVAERKSRGDSRLANASAARTTFLIVSLGGAVSGVLLLTAYFFLRREIASRHRSEEQLRSQIEISPLAVVEWDKDSTITRWAGTAEKMFGWSADEALGRPFTDLNMIHREDLPLVDHLMRRMIDGVTRQASLSNRNVTRDGRVIHCTWHNSVLCDARGRMISALSLAEDITEKTEANEKIRQFNVTLRQRVIERTMELNDSVSRLEAEIAERKRLEWEIIEVSEREQNRLGQDLHDNLGQQLAGIGLLAEVLANRLQSESHPAAADANHIKAYLTESISTSRNLAKSFYPVELERGGLMIALADLALRTEKIAKIPCVLNGDDGFNIEKSAEIHLYRIVQEAVINSLKHAKPASIVIDCRTLDGVWILSVTDDGSGYHPPQEGTRTGMGLSILQYRARMIGATVDVRQGETGGCVVTCILPVSALPDPAVP